MFEHFNNIENLYRFFNDESYNLDGFEKQYLWFNELNKFNDPFEKVIEKADFDLNSLSDDELATFCKVNEGLQWSDAESGATYYSTQLPYEGLKKFISKKREVIVEQLNDYIFNTIREMQSKKFHCLVHDIENAPLQNRLMWSHYSNGMRGFVFEFDFDLLLNSCDQKNNSFGGFTDINYMVMDFNAYIKKCTLQEQPLYLQSLIFTKHDDWKYENEIRLIGGENQIYYDISCVRRVIIGDRMPDKVRSRLLSIIESKNLQNITYIASVNRGDFSIKINKLYQPS